MIEEEDKPKQPEGEQQQRAWEEEEKKRLRKERQKAWREELRREHEELLGKSNEELQEELRKLSETDFIEEVFTEADKRKAQSGKPLKMTTLLQATIAKSIEKDKKLFDIRRGIHRNHIKRFQKIAEAEGLSMVEHLQVEQLIVSERMIFSNLEAIEKMRCDFRMKISPDLGMQLNTGETLEKVEKNTSTWRQLGLLVLVAFFSAVGAPLFDKYVIPVFEKRPSLLIPVGVGLVVVIGLFAFARWAIRKRVKKNRSGYG